MKLLFGVFTFLLLGFSSFAQAQVYKLDYTVTLGEELLSAMEQQSEDEGSDLSSLKSMMEILDGGKSAIEAWVTKDHYRLKSIYTEDWVVLGDKLHKTLYNINFADSTFIKAENPQGIFVQNEADSSGDEYDIEYVPGKTEMIAGFPCKLAVLTPLDFDFSEDEMPTIELWYTEKIEPFVWGQFSFLRQLPGAVLKLNLGGVNFETSKISLLDVEPDFFQVPANFKEVQGEEYTGFSEDMELGENLIAYYDTTSGYYGLKHVVDGVLTPAVYSVINEYHSSIAIAADSAGMYGLIDTKGAQVLPFTYQVIIYDEQIQAYNYSKDDKFSLMDKTGKSLWKTSYEFLGMFDGGLAVITSNELNGLVNKDGAIVVPAKYELIVEFNPTHFTVLSGENFQLYDLKSQKLLFEGFKEIYLANQPDLFIASEDRESYGYVNSKGETVIPFKYSMVSPFVDGKAAVIKMGSEESSFINIKGEEVKEDEE